MSRILVVDDEEPIRRLVASYLTDDGFVVEEAADGQAAVDRMRREPAIDLIVMDVRMPRLGGLDALSEIRRISDTYIILLTAAAEETDRLVGLSIGADDYITKPFSPREVVARVKAVLRRSRPGAVEQRSTLRFDSITIDVDERYVERNDTEVELTALQFDLLLALAESPRRVFTRHQLIERVWGRDFYGEDRIVDVHIGNLRKALADDSSDPHVIGTVRGVGYRFVGNPVG